MSKRQSPAPRIHRTVPQREAARLARERSTLYLREHPKPRPVAPGTPVRKDSDEIAFQALLRRELRRLKRLAARRSEALQVPEAQPVVETARPTPEPIEHGLHWGESPVDLPPWEDAREARGLSWTGSVLVISSALLLVFNSFAIGKWAGEQPVTAMNGALLAQASAYHTLLQGWGFDAPLEAARSVWRDAKALSWSDLGLGSGDVAQQSQTVPNGEAQRSR